MQTYNCYRLLIVHSYKQFQFYSINMDIVNKNNLETLHSNKGEFNRNKQEITYNYRNLTKIYTLHYIIDSFLHKNIQIIHKTYTF